MFSFLKNLFAADTARRDETPQADAAGKLEVDEPMAGAGAQLAGDHNVSETERNLKDSD